MIQVPNFYVLLGSDKNNDGCGASNDCQGKIIDDLISHLFTGLLDLFVSVTDGLRERTKAIFFFGCIAIFCVVAGCLLTGWASTLLFVLAGLSLIAVILVLCPGLN